MTNVLDIYEERGFLEQVTEKTLVRKLLDNPTACYIGFDPTAKSLHVGSLLPIMSLVHLQRMGHRPIIVIGGGTGMVGDPSGKTELRRVMTRDEIEENVSALKKQLERFLDFDNDKAIIINNADWLTKLNYIDFLRNFGRHFSVNRMLTAESYRARMKTGLSFIEFNYMLLQAYDFWYLFKHHNCRLQMGGNDQWGNILAGEDLIRRLERETVHGITFPLLTTSTGIKMGKTHKGAVWLDPDLTSPYDYYQYWINQDDSDIGRFLALFTLLPMKEVNTLGGLEGAAIREAKKILAYEATKLCHGENEAQDARLAAKKLFGDSKSFDSESIPTFSINKQEFDVGTPAFILFEKSGLCKSRSEARRLISQGGGYVQDQKILSFDQIINTKNLEDSSHLLLRAGKKRYMKIEIS